MLVQFLGTGTSTGVPMIGCNCEVCRSTDARDNRLRSSVCLTIGDKNFLIDCGPDFRQQMLRSGIGHIDAVLLTHEHYDHVGGLDDLRPFCRFGTINIYGNDVTLKHLHDRIPYCFKEHLYRGVPHLNLVEVTPHKEFSINGVNVIPLRVMHGNMEILGYRIGRMAYITDMTSASPDELEYLSGVELLVVNALRHTYHPTHQTVEQALDFAQKVGSQNTYLIHMSHDLGLHATEEALLPENVHFAYDGLELYF